MNQYLAKVISIVFHPLLLTTYAFLGILYCMPFSLNFSDSLGLKFLSMILTTTFVIPFAGIVVLKFTRTIGNLQMDDRKERFFPFLFICLFYIVTTFLFWQKFRFPPLVVNVMISISLTLVLLTIITLFWKISAHTTGISGTAGIFAALLFGVDTSLIYIALIVTLFLMGLVGAARLALNAHTEKQVWVGYVIGFLFNFTCVLILNSIA